MAKTDSTKIRSKQYLITRTDFFNIILCLLYVHMETNAYNTLSYQQGSLVSESFACAQVVAIH